MHQRAGRWSCCHPDFSRLLGLHAAQSDRIGEIGTGVGYGTAWMVGAMPSTARLVSIEMDRGRAAAAAECAERRPFRIDPTVLGCMRRC